MFDIGSLLTQAARLHALAAELAAGIDADVSGAQAVEVLAEMYAAGRQVDLVTCRLIERVDRTGAYAAEGAASTVAHVAREAGETPSWASKRVQVGRALADRLPTTGKAWQAGSLGLDHASVIDRATRDLDDDPDLVAVIDDALAGATPDASPKDLAGLAEHIRAQTAPEQTADKAARQYRAQKLSISQTLHGMWRIDGLLDPETGLLVSHAIAAFTRRPTVDGTAQAQPDPVLREPIAFRRALALAELCRQAIDHHDGCGSLGGNRHTIIAGIHLTDLQTGLGVGTATGEITLGAAALRRLGCDTGLIPAVLGTDGAVLDIGRRTRTIPTALRTYLAARDGGCVFGSCDRPVSWTEAHHRIAWEHGGPTDRENLDLLCVAHHHLVHEGGWTLTIADDPQRTPLFTPPHGGPPHTGQRRPLLKPPQQPNRPPTRIANRT